MAAKLTKTEKKLIEAMKSLHTWKPEFMTAKDTYEHLHEELLYTDEKQSFDEAVSVFEKINELLIQIGE